MEVPTFQNTARQIYFYYVTDDYEMIIFWIIPVMQGGGLSTI
jgi:hypothetical protein